jgi:putative membrane protein
MLKSQWIITGTLSAFFLAGCAVRPHSGPMMGPGLMGGGLFWLALFLVLGALAFLLIKRRNGPSDHPAEILKQRYVRGEISEEEFRRMKSEIEK